MNSARRTRGALCAVTGGAGFIGGHLVDALLSLGASISVIDDLSNADASHIAELIDLEPNRVRFTHGSLLEPAALEEAVEGAWRVFHLAAVASVPRSIVEPEASYAINCEGTLRVAQASVRAGVGRIVYAASSSAYGRSTELPKVESIISEPLSPYASSKLAGEHIMQTWAASYSISTVSLRYFNIFGPRQRADSAYAAVIPIFARDLLNAKAPVIHGDGGQTRDFTFVTNAVYANLLAGASTRPLAGEIVNVGVGERTSITELAQIMAELAGVSHIDPVREGTRAGDVRDSLASIDRAQELLGYRVLVPMREGLRDTLEWYRSVHADSASE